MTTRRDPAILSFPVSSAHSPLPFSRSGLSTTRNSSFTWLWFALYQRRSPSTVSAREKVSLYVQTFFEHAAQGSRCLQTLPRRIRIFRTYKYSRKSRYRSIWIFGIAFFNYPGSILKRVLYFDETGFHEPRECKTFRYLCFARLADIQYLVTFYRLR